MSDEDILKEVEGAAKRYWASINEPTEVSNVRIVGRLENGDAEVAVMWWSERMQDGDEMVYLVSMKDGDIDLALIEQP
jgi:hypothetical protein